MLSRYFGIETPINLSKGVREFKQLAQQLIDNKQPATFNQSIMEFGAVQCKPQNPDCNICPLNSGCVALQKQIVSILPIKLKKIIIKKRYLNYLVFNNKYLETVIRQRENKDIWQGLFEFPLVESKEEIGINELINNTDFQQVINNENFTISLYNNDPIIHKLTHQHLQAKFWIIKTEQKIDHSILWSDIEKYPVPILIHNFVENFKSKA